MSDRACESCRHWVYYDPMQSDRCEGECLLPCQGPSPMRLRVITAEGEPSGAVPSLVTAFDFSCSGWERRMPAEQEAQRAL